MTKVFAVTLVHPAAVMRGGFGHEPLAKRTLRRLSTRLRNPAAWPLLDITQPPPGCTANLNPTKAEILEWLAALPDSAPDGCAVDLEGNAPNIRLVGITRIHDLNHIAIHLLAPGPVKIWSPRDEAEILTMLRVKLPTVPLWFWNGQAFDYGEMVDPPLLFDVDRLAMSYYKGGDGMLMLRHAYAEQPAGLQYAAITFLGWCAWKWLVSQDDEEEGKA